MMRQNLFSRPLGKGTKWWMIATAVVSIVGAMSGRYLGFGLEHLAFSRETFLAGYLWTPFTYLFVSPNPFSLIINLVVIYFFGTFFESRWGLYDYLKFIGLSAVFAVLISIPLSYITTLLLPAIDSASAVGPGPVYNALLIAMALSAPDSQILMGFVLPMKVKTVVWLIIGFQILSALMQGSTNMAVTLGGLAIGYLLITGMWRPSRWRHYLTKNSAKNKRASHLTIVPDKKRTLH